MDWRRRIEDSGSFLCRSTGKVVRGFANSVGGTSAMLGRPLDVRRRFAEGGAAGVVAEEAEGVKM